MNTTLESTHFPTPNPSRIVLAGGSGFLGSVLADYFKRRGHEVVILARRIPRKRDTAVTWVQWDGRTWGDWAQHLEGTKALINLAGRSVDCRYHTRNRRLMMDSRLDSTRVLGEAIARCERPTRVWLNSSTATIYKHSFDRAMDEATGELGATPEAKDAFSIEVASAWEKTFAAANTPDTRKVSLRTAMVLGSGSNSVLPVLRRMARLGLGGTLGSGRQFVSWIHERDFCRAIEWLIENPELTGPINLSAPLPLPNREMMRIVRSVYRIPFGLPAPEWLLELGAFFLRTETELMIKSRRVVPKRLLESGFEFRFPHFRGAVEDLCDHPAEPGAIRTPDTRLEAL